MALIKCPECGKEISDTVKNCIHCGYVLKQETNVSPQQTIVTVEAPKKAKSSSKFLIIGITLFLIALSISAFNHISGNGNGFNIENDFYKLLISVSKIAAVVSFVLSLTMLAILKIRKTAVVIPYLILNLVSLFYIIEYCIADGGCFIITLAPQMLSLLVSYILIFISIFIKDEKQ